MISTITTWRLLPTNYKTWNRAISGTFSLNLKTTFEPSLLVKCPRSVQLSSLHVRPYQTPSRPQTSVCFRFTHSPPPPPPPPFPVPPSPTGQFSGQSGGRWSGLWCPFVGMTLNQLRLSAELLARLFIGAGAARE